MAVRLVINQAVGAGGTVANLLTGWQYQQAPFPGIVKILLRSTTATDTMIITTGAQTIQQKSAVPAGGTLGVTPTDFNTPGIVFRCAQGDQLAVNYFNGGAASNVDGYVEFQKG